MAIEQLIKKDCSTGETTKIYPITTPQGVINSDTGETLYEYLEMFNHLFLPFKDNSKAATRLQVPEALRRRGLYITYISYKGRVTTEFYNGTDFSDEAWQYSPHWITLVGVPTIAEAASEEEEEEEEEEEDNEDDDSLPD